jgi:hypothetical protein
MTCLTYTAQARLESGPNPHPDPTLTQQALDSNQNNNTSLKEGIVRLIAFRWSRGIPQKIFKK